MELSVVLVSYLSAGAHDRFECRRIIDVAEVLIVARQERDDSLGRRKIRRRYCTLRQRSFDGPSSRWKVRFSLDSRMGADPTLDQCGKPSCSKVLRKWLAAACCSTVLSWRYRDVQYEQAT